MRGASLGSSFLPAAPAFTSSDSRDRSHGCEGAAASDESSGSGPHGVVSRRGSLASSLPSVRSTDDDDDAAVAVLRLHEEQSTLRGGDGGDGMAAGVRELLPGGGDSGAGGCFPEVVAGDWLASVHRSSCDDDDGGRLLRHRRGGGSTAVSVCTLLPPASDVDGALALPLVCSPLDAESGFDARAHWQPAAAADSEGAAVPRAALSCVDLDTIGLGDQDPGTAADAGFPPLGAAAAVAVAAASRGGGGEGPSLRSLLAAAGAGRQGQQQRGAPSGPAAAASDAAERDSGADSERGPWVGGGAAGSASELDSGTVWPPAASEQLAAPSPRPAAAPAFSLPTGRYVSVFDCVLGGPTTRTRAHYFLPDAEHALALLAALATVPAGSAAAAPPKL